MYRSGLPDLTLWNPESGEMKFVEVKGPGDKLSYKQILWIRLAMKKPLVVSCRVSCLCKCLKGGVSNFEG